jgi:hypothetical protein
LGSGAACIDGNLSFFDPVLPPTRPITLDISGTVIADGAIDAMDSVFECWGQVYRALEVLDSDGVTWRIGYGLEDSNGDDVTPAMDLTPGDTVSVRYRAVQEFGSAHGFVVEDDAERVAALEVATWDNALLPDSKCDQRKPTRQLRGRLRHPGRLPAGFRR